MITLLIIALALVLLLALPRTGLAIDPVVVLLFVIAVILAVTLLGDHPRLR